MSLKLILSLFIVMSIGESARAMGDGVPGWLKRAAEIQARTPNEKAPAIVLHRELRRTVESDGKITSVTYYAVRLLSREGRAEAMARIYYNQDSERVKEFRAWLIRPTGEVKSYSQKEALDLALADNDVYNEARAKVILASDDSDTGCVFGYEVSVEESSVFSQVVWHFQQDLPVLLSRLTLVLPEGWRAEGITFNHARIEPTVNGCTSVWELRDLPFIEKEPFAPEVTNIAPRLAVSIFPPPGRVTPLKTFASWRDVSRYQSELSDSQAAYNEAMAAKVQELTAGSKTQYEKIRAIGGYAQKVNYISIQIGTGRGGGYRPHAALEVFAKNYGDCKDKANLMRAMLKALKIESYLIPIYSGDPSYVRAEWPSPYQFNHCIIGVKVGDEVEAATIIKHPSLGRLLIFDPTDEDTPVGDLPDYLQGSLALVAAGEAGDLIGMPVIPIDSSKLERRIEAELNPDGLLAATVRERSAGQIATSERRGFKRLAHPQYVKLIEAWITQTAPGAKLARVEPADDAQAGEFALDVEFKAPGYAQLMRGRLMVFKPAIVSRRSSLSLTAAKRNYPIVLEGRTYDEIARIKLPGGFAVDEMPEPVKLDRPFGHYAAECEVKDGQLIFKRALSLQSTTIPVEQYEAVRSFFESIRAAEQAPVVLVKK